FAALRKNERRHGETVPLSVTPADAGPPATTGCPPDREGTALADCRLVKNLPRHGDEATVDAADVGSVVYVSRAPASSKSPRRSSPEGRFTMKAAEIDVGGRYYAKISGRVVVVRVLRIVETSHAWSGRRTTKYQVLNEATGRVLSLSLMRFRGP